MQSEQKTLWFQSSIKLKDRSRGCYYITDEIVKNLPDVKKIKIGLLHLFLKHTSASICLNENYDPDVLIDMENSFNKIVPENQNFLHTIEGNDDMPAHVKSCLVGVSLSIPITNGALNLGTWQGIWLCEHRNDKHSRNVIATINGIAL